MGQGGGGTWGGEGVMEVREYHIQDGDNNETYFSHCIQISRVFRKKSKVHS